MRLHGEGRHAGLFGIKADYTCENGTVIPAAYVKARALIHTYGFGIGNTLNDACFDWVVNELTEDEAAALVEMPMGKRLSAYEFAAENGRALEECEQLCERIAEVLGLDEYHIPQIMCGNTDIMDFITARCSPSPWTARTVTRR